MKAMLLAASKMRGVPPQMLELVAGLGEVWSAQTLAVSWRSASSGRMGGSEGGMVKFREKLQGKTRKIMGQE